MYWIHDFSPWLMALVTVLVFLTVAIGGLLLSRRFVTSHLIFSRDINDAVNYFGSAMATLYSVTLGLIAVASWQNYSSVEGLVSKTASTIGVLYRDMGGYPDPLSTEPRQTTPSRVQVPAPAPAAPPVTAPNDPGQPFLHPGLFSGQSDLETIRRRLADRHPDDPMVAGWQSIMASRFNNVDFHPEPVVFVTRENKSPSPVNERDAATVSYVLALRWVLSGDEAAQAKALSIMKAWADVFQDHRGDVNTSLDSAWVLTVWSAAGELLRYGRYLGHAADWPAADLASFSTMLRRLEAQSAHILTDPQWKGHTGNWDSSAMLADMAAGVFLDDRAMYERGRDMLLKFMPQMLHREGWATEIFRDPWHGGVSLTAVIEAAEIARHQGDASVYEAKYDHQTDPRIAVCLRWYANPLRGIPSETLPAMKIGPAYLHKEAGWRYDAKGNARNTGGFEMALNYYTRITHLAGLDDFKDMTLHEYRPSGQDNSIYITSDTLTHGDLN